MGFRLTKVKECRCLTLWGWILILGCIAVAFFVWAVTIHDFLAVNKPLNTNISIVEGYVPDFVLDSIATSTKNNSDLLLVCAGLPVEKGNLCSDYVNYADYNAAALLLKVSDSIRVISAPALYTNKERTYTTALAAKQKLRQMGYTAGNINVLCLGTHARRSRLLYSKAFESEWKVGVIAYPNNTYPADAWWKNSEGARDVIYEMFAYLYCLIFFHP